MLLNDDAMMLNRPLCVSLQTTADDRYQGTRKHAIEIETGDAFEGINIVVEEVY